MEGKVSKIASDWQALKKQMPNMEFGKEAKRVFFETLDLAQAINYNDTHTEEMARIEQLNKEVKNYTEETQTEPETAQNEPQTKEKEATLHYDLQFDATNAQIREIMEFLKNAGVHGRVRIVK